jgi:carboxymethylenebutenolidase
MSEFIQLHTADGHTFDAYLARPTGAAKAGIVVLQEIFGVNGHVRSVTDGLAWEGFLVLAPALFDRLQHKVELGYTPDAIQQGVKLMQGLRLENTLADIQAAIVYLRQQTGVSKVGVVGYCWGGKLAWLSNTRLHPDATVSYYPGGIQDHITEKATCPAIFHFGLHDAHIPLSVVEQVQQEYPGFPVFTYDAGHGFNCDARESYNEKAAALARTRTLAHFEEHLVHAAH